VYFAFLATELLKEGKKEGRNVNKRLAFVNKEEANIDAGPDHDIYPFVNLAIPSA
jgi:hypothetical protein